MPHASEPLRTDGKFFRAGNERVPLLAVTYGPFPDDYPTPEDEDFARIAEAGFNAVRTYTLPGVELLDAAHRHGLRVFAGLEWGYPSDFGKRPGIVTQALVKLANFLRDHGQHPALTGVYVANEIRADLVRWMGPDFVRDVLEQLITEGRRAAPHLLFAYANYPSTEYLEPANADFTAFNIYLEKEQDYRAYLKRLHHIAGDRPLVISEFGLDTRRNSPEKQADALRWGATISREEEAAGFTVYSWSDRWATGGREILDWDFGMTDRGGAPKEALLRWDASLFTRTEFAPSPFISVIICTRNGIKRIESCLEAVSRMTGGGFETIVVDDGSEDGTADLVATRFPGIRLLRLEPGGLSAARNAGAAAARGEVLAFTDDDCEPDIEWVARLRRVFHDGKFAAAGGPNLPPPPRDWREAVVCAAPGAPSHVMLTDDEAEHLPGCNIAVTKEAFNAVGGFDPQFRTAGDDVDFCWRLREAGYRLGFAAGAFVWHWRRPSFSAFFRQQQGYAKAERLLIAKHPGRFSKRGGARWEGFVYGGGPVRATRDSIIYHGPMGTAGYQHVMNRMLPLRGLDERHDTVVNRLVLDLVTFIQPRLRAWGRNHAIVLRSGAAEQHRAEDPSDEFGIQPKEGQDREFFLKFLVDRRWKPGGDTDEWDVEKNGTRVLLATEYRNHKPVILFRVWGPAEQLMLYMGVNRKRR
ncbi:MAG: glycosyltransferase [Akkermansiaceae bacterium]|nr:glycosyltransferase [Akkermansiaceae bacterium]